MSKVIEQLAAARKAARLSRTALASKTGLARMTIQKAETDQGDPRLSTIEVLARELGMELMLVPAQLRPSLEGFIQSGGRFLGQPSGAGAPKSIVDVLTAQETTNTGKHRQ